MKTGVLLLLALRAALLAAAPEQPLTDAAQDATGRVWATPHDEGDTLYASAGEGWQPVRVAAAGRKKAWARTLGPGPDGAVLCLWKSETHDEEFLTRHLGDRSEPFARLAGEFPQWHTPHIFTDSRGVVWLVDPGPFIRRLNGARELEVAHTIPRERFRRGGKPLDREPPYYNAIRALEDARGRVWFFNAGEAPGGSAPALGGVVVFDGEAFTHRDIGTANRPVTSIARRGAGHVRVSVPGDGVFDVDLETFAAERLAEPEPGTLTRVRHLFQTSDAWFFVSDAASAVTVETIHDPAFRHALWQLEDGAWRKAVPGLDAHSSFGNIAPPPRPWLETADAVLVAGFNTGLWSIPRAGGEAELLDWRAGFTVTKPTHLFRAGGNVVALSAYRTAFAGPLGKVRDDARARILRTGWALARDERGHLFGILSETPRALSEWDGERWRAYPLPAELRATVRWIDSDERGRIWLLPYEWEKSVAIFTPQTGRWQLAPSLAAALQAEASFAEPAGPRRWMRPAFSKDGKAAYANGPHEVSVFDGQDWKMWTTGKIRSTQGGPPGSLPFFDERGRVCVSFAKVTRRLGADGWEDAPPAAAPAEARREWQPPAPAHGCADLQPDSAMRDDLGRVWLTARGQLYKSRESLCLPAFAPDERHPFIDGRRLHEALVDARGAAFLLAAQTPPSSGIGVPSPPFEYVIVPSLKSSPPETQIAVTARGEDSFTARFSAAVEGDRWFTWRLDGGPWSTPARDAEARFDALAAGPHMLEAAALDADLRLDPTPAEAPLIVTIDSAAQLRAWIAALSDPAFAKREAAVAALLRRGAEALPALRAARPSASEDARWWIDATIQQLEAKPRAR